MADYIGMLAEAIPSPMMVLQALSGRYNGAECFFSLPRDRAIFPSPPGDASRAIAGPGRFERRRTKAIGAPINRTSHGSIKPPDGFAAIFARNVATGLYFPPQAELALHREAKKAQRLHSPLRFEPLAAGRPPAVKRSPSRSRWSRPDTPRGSKMANIGTFTKTSNGFAGSIKTLAVEAEIDITRVEKTAEKAPDFRVYTGTSEIGAAWSMTSKEGRDYVSVKIDDPSLAAPLYASLMKAEEPDEYTLIWSRPKGE